jgi:hypothetical protein
MHLEECFLCRSQSALTHGDDQVISPGPVEREEASRYSDTLAPFAPGAGAVRALNVSAFTSRLTPIWASASSRPRQTPELPGVQKANAMTYEIMRARLMHLWDD